MRILIILIASFLLGNDAISQIPTEVFAGDKKLVVDIMFFNYFKTREDENSKFLFFNRNKAYIDYRMTPIENLPQFGFTEAISYNLPVLKGTAPVIVVQAGNNGIYEKAGFQYTKLRSNMILFGWLISELKTTPDIDLYLLLKFTPSISDKLKIYSHFESLNTFSTSADRSATFRQTIRLGLLIRRFAFGIGSDLKESRDSSSQLFPNTGVFIRYEFK